jgi:hypothetical protein
MIPRIAKFVLVDNPFLNNFQAKIDTFKGTCLCQVKFTVASKESGE